MQKTKHLAIAIVGILTVVGLSGGLQGGQGIVLPVLAAHNFHHHHHHHHVHHHNHHHNPNNNPSVTCTSDVAPAPTLGPDPGAVVSFHPQLNGNQFIQTSFAQPIIPGMPVFHQVGC